MVILPLVFNLEEETIMQRSFHATLFSFLVVYGLASCSESGDTPSDASVTADTGTSSDGGTSDCDSATDATMVAICRAEAFLTALDSTQRTAATYEFSDSVNKTCWSNLPGQNRPGVTFGALDATQRAMAMTVAESVLSTEGFQDFRGLLAADDYLAQQGGGGGGNYGSDNAHIAVFGTPSIDSDWMLSIGNHHLAYNITFVTGTGYPTPNHQGAEPRTTFTIDGETFGPLVSEGDAFVALFSSLDANGLASAKLTGTFGDVLLGPDEYCTGSYDAVVFPTGAQREGVLVSTLTANQQTMVTNVITEWVADYQPIIADQLISDYTSTTAYANTYIAWAGNGSEPDVTVNGTYFRIDGPRAWIEVSCQNGVVLSGTHYHTIYRDKSYDYGAEL